MAYDWIKVRPTSGTGPTSVTATISSHSGYETRSKTVTVSATIDGTTTSKSVSYTQAGSSVSGDSVIKLGGVAYTQGSLTPAQIMQNINNTLTFELNDTNAKNFQYYVELVTGSMAARDVTGVLAAPTISATIQSITNGTTITFASLTSTTTTLDNNRFRITYTLPTTDESKGVGKYQQYSVALNSKIVGTYANNSSKPVGLKYGIDAIIATGANMTGTTSVPLKSLSVTYSQKEFDITGGDDKIGLEGSEQVLEISGPTNMTWTATVV